MPPESSRIVAKPRLLFRPDPVIGWSLTPGHAVRVKFRDNVVQTIDADGWRTVPERPSVGHRLAVYGCSFTYGTGLLDEETYCAVLQRQMPDVQILNRGIGGHGTVQNLLQFRRDIADGTVDAAVFTIIEDHRFRNIAHPRRMRQYLAAEWYKLGVEHVPVCRMTANGEIEVHYVPLWQPAIRDADFDIFLPDIYMINNATLAVLDLVRSTAQQANIPLHFVLLDRRDPVFNEKVLERFPTTVDTSTRADRNHTFLPMDIHPNMQANRIFAQGMIPVLEDLRSALDPQVRK